MLDCINRINGGENVPSFKTSLNGEEVADIFHDWFESSEGANFYLEKQIS